MSFTIVYPRYTVGSVSGYGFMEGGRRYIGDTSGGGNRKPKTTWYVYDRLNCCRQVAVFEGGNSDYRARADARRRNACYLEWVHANVGVPA